MLPVGPGIVVFASGSAHFPGWSLPEPPQRPPGGSPEALGGSPEALGSSPEAPGSSLEAPGSSPEAPRRLPRGSPEAPWRLLEAPQRPGWKIPETPHSRSSIEGALGESFIVLGGALTLRSVTVPPHVNLHDRFARSAALTCFSARQTVCMESASGEGQVVLGDTGILSGPALLFACDAKGRARTADGEPGSRTCISMTTSPTNGK